MSIMEFGFDDGKVIKNQGVDQFKQSRPNERTRISIVSFKKVHDVILGAKAKEKGSPLTDAEKAEFIAKIDARLAEQLKKPVGDLTEVDRLDIKQPRFGFAFTHYNESVGTIRCLSKYEGSTLAKPELCCDRFGDADQTVGAVIMTYPVDSDLQVDRDLLLAKKYTNFYVYKLSAKKFQKLQAQYVEARNDKRFVIDVSVTLDGDPKYQKQNFSAMSAPVWAQDGFDPAIRHWILDQGLRAFKHVGNNLGFEMTKDKLVEKLSGGPGAAQLAAGTSEASQAAPALIGSYDELI
jgi:hypothetical protein